MATTGEFQVAECTIDDVEDMVVAYHSAFSEEAVHQWCFPSSTCTSETEFLWLRNRFGSHLKNPGPGVKHFKLVHAPTGKLASFGRWVFPHPKEEPKTQEEMEEQERKEKEKDMPSFPPGANAEACKEFFGKLEDSQKKWVKGDEMYVMGLLATVPEFQRMGCATKLLRHVLDMADREEKKCYIEATRPGLPVYERLGWKTVEILHFSVDEEDVKAGRVKEEDRVGIHWVLIREPQPVADSK